MRAGGVACAGGVRFAITADALTMAERHTSVLILKFV